MPESTLGDIPHPNADIIVVVMPTMKLRNIKPLFQFRTLSSTNIEFPEKRPQLFTEHTRYEPGDVLRANCSTPPSRPRAELRFTINQVPVSTTTYVTYVAFVNLIGK